MNTSHMTLTKLEKMDSYIFSEQIITAGSIRSLVMELFNIDLQAISDQNAEFIKKHGDHPSFSLMEKLERGLVDLNSNLTGESVRHLINTLFGVNLNGVSALEKARISLFSKGQWIVQSEKDLFIVITSLGDAEVEIYPTPYFYERTKTDHVPESLRNSLIDLGYSHNERQHVLIYREPANQPVEDSFKGQTMGAILKVIQTQYAEL